MWAGEQAVREVEEKVCQAAGSEIRSERLGPELDRKREGLGEGLTREGKRFGGFVFRYDTILR